MNLIESVVIAFRGISANRLRSFLTMLGIVIGIGAVISLMSVGRGVEVEITARLEGLGTNLIFVRPAGRAAALTIQDAEAIADPANVPSAALVAPEISTFFDVVAGPKSVNAQILGVTPAYAEVRNIGVAEGEFITPQDERSMVALLGANVAEALFYGDSPIGEWVKINQHNFRVIGVLESRGGMDGPPREMNGPPRGMAGPGDGMMAGPDDAVMVPITTAMYQLIPQRPVSLISVQAIDANEVGPAIEQITTLLRQRHRITGDDEDSFIVIDMGDILEMATEITAILTIFLGSIAGIALLVGGIGVMNIMLVSVTERTREIGIRKAVGAKRRDILMQFLIESATLSLSGGLIGLLLGWGLSRLISGIAMSAGHPLPTVMAPDIVILAVSVTIGIGLFFGIYPAMRAARLNPIDALRYE
ncbi:MAG: Macrolide export ATP-binding/permease protein MacB [Dehalococcoidia bacterium]|nr:Macrolide export ATP-binding/permease protein MacB [Chloroflexota bacterium]MBT9162588.1 Macrolide export ATP-binding/permease protein MacB [Chloroflexota bacterium]